VVAADTVVAGMGSLCGSGSCACVVNVGVVAASFVEDESVSAVTVIAVDAVGAYVVVPGA